MNDHQAILLIESDPLSARAIEHALRRLADDRPLVHAVSIDEAVLLLRHRCDREPCLVLGDGRDTEDWRRLLGELSTPDIPVLAMTEGSLAEAEALRRRSEITDVLVKTGDYAELAERARCLVTRWLKRQRVAAAA